MSIAALSMPAAARAGVFDAYQRLAGPLVEPGAHAIAGVGRAVSRAAGRCSAPRVMANRGVWESGWWLGPTVSVAHGPADVDRDLEVLTASLAEVT